MGINITNLRGYQRFGEIAGITEQNIINTFTGITSMNIVDLPDMQKY